MSLALDEDELWRFVEGSHTGILTTLRRDGWPVALPLWFAVAGRSIVMTTPGGSRKVSRIKRDPRASFLIETGEMWRELKAVMFYGECAVIDDPAEHQRIDGLIEAKYASSFGFDRSRLPNVTQERYRSKVAIRFVVTEPPLSWDNGKIRLRGDA